MSDLQQSAWSEGYRQAMSELKPELDRLRAELDVINKSHADLAHRLADLGRENERLRELQDFVEASLESIGNPLIIMHLKALLAAARPS